VPENMTLIDKWDMSLSELKIQVSENWKCNTEFDQTHLIRETQYTGQIHIFKELNHVYTGSNQHLIMLQ